MDLQTVIEWRTTPDRAVRLFKSHPFEAIKEAVEKNSFNALGELGEYLQLFPGKTFGIPGKPSPLASMLVGGLTGAGLGYGLGRAAEWVMPDTWQRGRARRTFAAMGGLLGASPGLAWAAMNANSGESPFSGKLGTEPVEPLIYGPWHMPIDVPEGYEQRAPAWTHNKLTPAANEFLQKSSVDYGETGLFGAPPINVEEFNRTVWQDPQVAGRLTLPQQAAASGMITGAANLPGKYSPRFVTPLDMGRMALGMGSGYLAGATVGRVLGFLLGMPQESQDRLKQTGVMAGAIANALPIVFG